MTSDLRGVFIATVTDETDIPVPEVLTEESVFTYLCEKTEIKA
jgi:hypothetical protein